MLPPAVLLSRPRRRGVGSVAPPVFDHWNVVPSTTVPIAGAVVNLTAQAVDQYNNPWPGVRTVNWTKTGGGSLGSASNSTNAGGLATNTLTTSTTVGDIEVVTADDGAGHTGSTPNIVTQAAPAVMDHWVVTPSTTTPIAGAVVTLTAQAYDQYLNPFPGVRTANWTKTGGGTLTTGSNSTNAGGVATNTMTTSASIGDVETVSVNDGAGHTGTSPNITTQAAPAVMDHYVVIPSTVTPIAGAAVTLTAQATDQYNNPFPGVRPANWTKTGGGSLATGSGATNSAGVATNTLTTSTTVGDVEVVSVDDGAAGHSGTSAPITTQAGATGHFPNTHFATAHFPDSHFP